MAVLYVHALLPDHLDPSFIVYGQTNPTPCTYCPVMTSITPAAATAGTSQPVTINGMNLNLGTLTVTISGSNVSAVSGTLSPTSAAVTISPGSSAALGARLITLTTTLGSSNAFCCFLVNSSVPGPTLNDINPKSAAQGSSATTITVDGSGFDMTSVVRANGTSLLTTFVNSGQLTAQIPASLLSNLGLLGVSVVNNSVSTSGFAVFTVLSPSLPILAGVEPWGLAPGTTTTGFFVGGSLLGASASSVTGSGVSVSILPGATSKNVPVTITVAPDAAPGARMVSVTTPAGTRGAVEMFSNFVVAYGGNWRLTQPSQKTRAAGATATLLADGKVLMTGANVNTAEVFDPASSSWVLTNTMAVARTAQTAALLSNGKVLVAAGFDPFSSFPLGSSELYDPTSGSWTPTGFLNEARYSHTATVLNDGRVLVAGGAGLSSQTFLTSAELYDPSTGLWTTTGNLNVPRAAHTATLLPNGKVLVTGGNTGSATYTASCEVYDPATGTWTSVHALNLARSFHAAALLPNGKVFVAGGMAMLPLESAEIYDPDADTWTLTNLMSVSRPAPTATLLNDGRVLVVGNTGSGQSVINAELYDPASGAWSLVPPSYIWHSHHIAVLLSDGSVLIAAGLDGTFNTRVSEVFDPTKRTRRGQITTAN